MYILSVTYLTITAKIIIKAMGKFVYKTNNTRVFITYTIDVT